MNKLQSKEEVQAKLKAIQESIDAHPHDTVRVLTKQRVEYTKHEFSCSECGSKVGEFYMEAYSGSLFKEAVSDFSEGTLGGWRTNENI